MLIFVPSCFFVISLVLCSETEQSSPVFHRLFVSCNVKEGLNLPVRHFNSGLLMEDQIKPSTGKFTCHSNSNFTDGKRIKKKKPADVCQSLAIPASAVLKLSVLIKEMQPQENE